MIKRPPKNYPVKEPHWVKNARKNDDSVDAMRYSSQILGEWPQAENRKMQSKQPAGGRVYVATMAVENEGHATAGTCLYYTTKRLFNWRGKSIIMEGITTLVNLTAKYTILANDYDVNIEGYTFLTDTLEVEGTVFDYTYRVTIQELPNFEIAFGQSADTE